jgi:hypothetical protein
MERLTIKLVRAKETKNTVRYAEPETITVTIEGAQP